MNAGEEWTERRSRGQPRLHNNLPPPHSVDSDACSTLRGLERLSADLCRSLGGVSARPSTLSDPLLQWSGGQDARLWQPHEDRVHGIPLSALWSGKHVVAMSCKSSLCLRCAKVAVDNSVSQVSRVLHEGVIYRHIILTVPAMFRTTFYQNAAVVLSALIRCGAQCLDDFYSTVKGKALKGGYITVLHTHGRNGQYHPHLHVLATSGGYDAQGARWEHLQYLPYDLLRRKWQWHLLRTLRKTLATDAIKQLVDGVSRSIPTVW